MLHLKNILVPRDFTPGAEAALGVALDLAGRTGATLHLLFAEVLYEGADVMLGAAADAAALEARLVEGVEAERVEHAVVRDVAAAPAILHYAREHDVDLVVMGTHGRRGVRRLLLGSVAEEVVRMAPCPVLAVHHREAPPAASADIRAVLVPIDFSRHARVALAHAREVATLFGAHLDLLHVVEDGLHPAFYNTGVMSIYDLQPDIDERALAELEQFFQETEGPAVEARFHVRSGHAAREIVRFAEEQPSDLVVMATHGLRGLEHFLLGSVAEKVVRGVPVPVFTVKSFGKRLVDTPAAEAVAAHVATP